MTKYFDSHAHYDNSNFNADRKELLAKLPLAGVEGVINAGACVSSSKASVALAEEYSYIYATVGVHPHEASKMKDSDLDTIKSLSQHKKTVAIGEIGLDFHYDNSPREIQRKRFAEQLALAKSLDMPVVIHSREAAAETMAIIKESGVSKGVLHCYSGHLPMALQYIEMGFYISLSGVITYKNAEKSREVAAGIPLEYLMIETDAPYLTPVPFRRERNDSTKLPFIAEIIAEVRGITTDAVSKATTENVKRMYQKLGEGEPIVIA
ncbi:MAG: TatD family hydrolase [Defluviitaleaceae bacterium]|nr:TatD family hydrolase [Defluviitaleaceae bacterium]